MTSFLKRQWPLFGLGVLVAVVGFYLVKSGKEVFQEPFFEEIMSEGGLKLKDIHYTHDDPDEGLKWILDASEVRFSADKKSILFHDFRLTMEPESRVFLELKGNRGDYSRDSGEINLWGNLEGSSENGYRIVTEHILINERSGHLSTDKAVKIFGPFFSVAGQGLIVDLGKKRLKILSDVTAIVDRGSLI
jgi:LPS export ABC transporter protein LptC